MPHFILSRFASERDQLLVRDRLTGRTGLRAAADMAVRDFYTFLDTAGELNSTVESLHGLIEEEASAVLRRHLDVSTFAKRRPFTIDERAAIDTLVAAQMTRGMRQRRATELFGDYFAKSMVQREVAADDLGRLRIVPHQNEHIELAAQLSARVYDHLATRSVQVITLDRPLLWIGDEPVVLVPFEGRSDPGAQVRVPQDPDGAAMQLVLVNQPAAGILGAEEIAMPVSPEALLVYGPIGVPVPLMDGRVRGIEAEQIAGQINQLVIAGSVDWVAAHPEQSDLRTLTWPEPSKIMRVWDGGTAVGEQLNTAPHRRPERLAKDAPVRPKRASTRPMRDPDAGIAGARHETS